MLKKLFLISALAIIFTSCENTSDSNDKPGDTTELSSLNNIQEIALADFESRAGEFVNKEIKISGIVDHVCKHGGKKILLVDGDHSIHVFNDKRYDDKISGSEVTLTGIVEEEKIDETYLTEWWNHALGSHSDGTEADKKYLAGVEKEIKQIRDSLKNAGVDYFPEYSLKYVSHIDKTVKK